MKLPVVLKTEPREAQFPVMAAISLTSDKWQLRADRDRGMKGRGRKQDRSYEHAYELLPSVDI